MWLNSLVAWHGHMHAFSALCVFIYRCLQKRDALSPTQNGVCKAA